MKIENCKIKVDLKNLNKVAESYEGDFDVQMQLFIDGISDKDIAIQKELIEKFEKQICAAIMNIKL